MRIFGRVAMKRRMRAIMLVLMGFAGMSGLVGSVWAVAGFGTGIGIAVAVMAPDAQAADTTAQGKSRTKPKKTYPGFEEEILSATAKGGVTHAKRATAEDAAAFNAFGEAGIACKAKYGRLVEGQREVQASKQCSCEIRQNEFICECSVQAMCMRRSLSMTEDAEIHRLQAYVIENTRKSIQDMKDAEANFRAGTITKEQLDGARAKRAQFKKLSEGIDDFANPFRQTVSLSDLTLLQAGLVAPEIRLPGVEPVKK